MHPRRPSPWVAAFFWAAFLSLPSRATVDDDFTAASTVFDRAKNFEQSGAPKYALLSYNECYAKLQKIRAANPTWNSDKVSKEMADCVDRIDKLSVEVNKPPAPAPIPADIAASAPPTSASNPPPLGLVKYEFTDPPGHIHNHYYPWRTGIVTTVFWIGEDGGSGNERSAWDPHWVRHNGGADDQYNLNGYASAGHASTLNPFYVSLPFNDLAHPDKAAKWLPAGWAAAPTADKTVSACKGRWIEIKNRAGRVCFAQWEDAGPGASDDVAYVFGNAKPAASSGLGISPAVAKYLGVDSSAYTSWRFVDDEDVLPGMWLRYDEQAILFNALHEQQKSQPASAPAAH